MSADGEQQMSLFEEPAASDSALLIDLLNRADEVFVKKLALNDWSWATPDGSNQNGPYFSAAIRLSGFFPPLALKPRAPGERDIYEAYFPMAWPQVERERLARLVNYTSKGSETQLTGLPKEAFSDLAPASFIVIGRFGDGADRTWRAITVDSRSDDAILLTDQFALGPDFSWEFFKPAEARQAAREELLDFADQVFAAWRDGRLDAFSLEHGAIPDTATLALRARQKFIQDSGLANLDPLLLEHPGDDLLKISRKIEWEMFRTLQLRSQAVDLVRMLVGDASGVIEPRALLRRLVDAVSDIDKLMLRGGQQRKSRAGYSFEHHIEAMLQDGALPFQKQVVMASKKRPDFILPSLKHLKAPAAGKAQGLILSAKTTLRERWKQVELEKVEGELFLATVDENIAANAIDHMAKLNIRLVVPESLLDSEVTAYAKRPNVLSFRQFFREDMALRRASWGKAAKSRALLV